MSDEPPLGPTRPDEARYPPPSTPPVGGGPPGHVPPSQGQWGQGQWGQPSQWGQPGYGQPYGYGYAYAQDHPNGTVVLVLGICSLVVCQILGPVAWIMGDRALREIDANPSAYANRSAVQAGRICGIISTAIMVVLVVLIVALVLIGNTTSSSS